MEAPIICAYGGSTHYDLIHYFLISSYNVILGLALCQVYLTFAMRSRLNNRCLLVYYNFSTCYISLYQSSKEPSVLSMSFNFIDLFIQVLSMSRLGGAGAVAQLVSDVPLSAVEVIILKRMKFRNATFLTSYSFHYFHLYLTYICSILN